MYEQLKIFVPVWLFKEVFMVAEPEREITWDMLAKPDFIGIDTSEDALHIDEQVGIREMELFLQEIDALSDQSTLYIMHNMLNHSVDLKSSTLLGRTEAERLNDLARGRESIARLDDQLGKLIKKLKDKGIFDSSILVIHTDTGNEVANSILAKGPARIENTDELARVVLLVKRPNQQSRRDLEQLVGQRDILPIILHHAKIDASNVQFDGRAIVDPDDTGSVEDRALRYTNFGFVYELENPATHWSRIN